MITLAELRRRQNVAAAARNGAMARAAIQNTKAKEDAAKAETRAQKKARLQLERRRRYAIQKAANEAERQAAKMRAKRDTAVAILRDPSSTPRQRTRAIRVLGIDKDEAVYLEMSQGVVPPFVAEISEQVAARHGIPVSLMYVKTRSQAIVRARQEMFWLVRNHRSAPCWTWMAKWFGLDHSTVLYGANQHEARLEAAGLLCQDTISSGRFLGITRGQRAQRLFVVRSAELELAS